MNKLIVSLAAVLLLGTSLGAEELLNVSYDPTREFYRDFNKAFAAFWKSKTGKDISVNQSHRGTRLHASL